MKFLLLFPDGIGLRNFVLTRFLSLLCEKDNVVIWHALLERAIQADLKNCAAKVRWTALPYHHEGHLPFLFRRAKLLAQLHWQEEPGTDMVLSQSVGKGTGIYRLRNQTAEALGRICGRSHSQILWLNHVHAHWVERQPYFKSYLAFLEKEKPDIMFCSHQRSEIAVPAMLAARKLGIPTATFIYSWDNLPKGRMAVYADYFLVWSQHMQDEMLQYYPDIAADRIFIVGTPQFEHYFNSENLEPRETFLRRHDLDPVRPVVCFSGDDIATSPHDPDYLEDLALALERFPKETRPQILFRRTPTDVSGRYEAVLKRHPEIVGVEPAWINLADNDWTKVIPTNEDVRLLVNTVKHSDFVVNVGSTMALDFAINHKPAIYLAYNPDSQKGDENWQIEDVYRFPHFNHIGQFDPVYWARSKEQLPQLIRACLEEPEDFERQRQAWVNFLVQPPLEQASQRCASALFQIVNKKTEMG
ncbi:MAG: hypothetical protein HONDAALG_04131 [Gammaproteobacteria bacterium]|nr:hypothetical protein [Gammaproteobacteria bacterium]